MFKYLFKHIRDIVTIIALIVIGVLLLVNPTVFAPSLVRIVGILLTVLGLIRIIRYFPFRSPAGCAADNQTSFPTRCGTPWQLIFNKGRTNAMQARIHARG